MRKTVVSCDIHYQVLALRTRGDDEVIDYYRVFLDNQIIMPEEIPAQTAGVPPAPVPSDGSVIIPPEPAALPKEEKKSFSAPATGAIVFGVLLLVGVMGSYFFYVVPRKNAVRLVDQLKPHVATLKSATSEVIDNLNRIYTLATEQEKADPKQNLQTRGLLIRPDVASLANSAAILGSSIETGQKAIVERGLREVAKSMRGSMRTVIQPQSDVLGVTEPAEDPSMQTFRSLKAETVKAGESVRKAEASLTQLVSITQSLPSLSADAKGKITSSGTLKISANGYLSEAKKIAEYYQTLSDIVIEMNTKITSFKSALSSAGTGFGAVLQSGNSVTAKTTLAQVQVFLDQGNKDMQDMKKLSEKLTGMPNELLPMASAEYHAHNIKVLQAATTYFTAQSGILQVLVSGAKTIVEKAEQNTLASSDLITFRSQLATGVSQSALSDAKFASDLQTLQGEEGSLTISFWQNNTRLGDGAKVAEAVGAYQTSLEKLRKDNVINGLVR